ncbi:MAG: YbhB/YbcL family Raf kinase inhibitor-like protein [Thiohalocapsa sp.]
MPLVLMSPAIAPGGMIPREYTCDGSDISPPLNWSGVPAGTASLILVIEDPDAPRGTFRHWGAYDIAPTTPGLTAGYRAGQPAADFREARNDFGRTGYGGPCPPPGGGVHHYHFELLALRRPSLGLPPGAGIASVLSAAAPYVIERAELVGTYQR